MPQSVLIIKSHSAIYVVPSQRNMRDVKSHLTIRNFISYKNWLSIRRWRQDWAPHVICTSCSNG